MDQKTVKYKNDPNVSFVRIKQPFLNVEYCMNDTGKGYLT